MKRLILLLWVSLFTMVAGAQKVTFEINGEIPGKDGREVYLIEFAASGPDTIGRAVIQDGVFGMTGTAEKNAKLQCRMEDERYFKQVIFIDADKIRLVADEALKDCRVVGGKENEVEQLFAEAAKKFVRKLEESYRKTKKIKNDSLTKEYHKDLLRLIKENPNSVASVCKLLDFKSICSFDELQEYEKSFSKKALSSVYGKELKEYVKVLETLQPGKTAPDFTFKNTKGEPVNLHRIEAKVKILDFWATWCIPCIAENKNLSQLYQIYRDKGLEIISVSVDDAAKSYDRWVKMAGQHPWVQVIASEGIKTEEVQKYSVQAIPTIYVLDENNRIIGKYRGNELKEKVAELLR